MPIRPKYRLGRTRPIAARQFTDREEFIQIFRDAIQGKKRRERSVLVYYGVGGIGKTSLRNALTKVLEDTKKHTVWAVLDFEVPSFREQETALFALRRSLRQRYKIKFPTFDLVYAVYWKKTRPQIPMNKETFPLLEGEGIVADMIRVVGSLSGVALIGLAPTISKIVVKGQKHIRDWWRKLGEEELSKVPQLEPKEIAERLPMYWAVDLREYLQQRKSSAVIFIDSYEALWESGRSEVKIFKQDEWVRELVSQLSETLWVICGRERLRWSEYDPDWSRHLRQHLVGGLADEDATSFLRSCQITNDDIQKVIVEGSKGVPYYLDLAVDTYFEVIGHYHRRPVAADFARTPKEVFLRFFRYLDKSEIETLKVLSVPRFWDYSLFELLVDEFKTGYPVTAFAELCRFSFISQGVLPGTWSMHQLMRESLREHFESNVQKAVCQFLFNHYNGRLKGMDIRNMTDEHKSALTEAFHYGRSYLDTAEFFNWFIKAAAPFDQAAQWKLLIPLYEEITEILKKSLGQEHLDIAKPVDNLARLHHAQGEYAETESLYRLALEIREKSLGPDHPEVAQSFNNLADLYRDQGKYVEAEPLYRRGLEIREEAFGSDHYCVAESLNSLAILLWSLGRYAEAELCFRRAIEIRRKTLGPDHAEVAESINNLAVVYWKQGRYSEAEPLCRQALEIREKTLGPHHHNVAESANNLALICVSQKKYAEAEILYKRALQIKEKAFEPDHFKVAIFLNNLATLYWNQGRYAETEPLYKQALEILEKTLGRNHHRVGIAMDNLAKLYCSQGRYAEAEPATRQALEILEKALGPRHPDLARSLNTLANLHRDQGKYAQAEPLYRRALSILENVHGQAHPDIAVLLEDLAELYKKTAKDNEARKVKERAVQIRSKMQ